MAAMSRTENLGIATTSTVSGGIRRPPSGVTAATELARRPEEPHLRALLEPRMHGLYIAANSVRDRHCDGVAPRVGPYSWAPDTQTTLPCHTPSRPGEFHPEPLTDPYVSLSTYTARAIARRLPPSAERRAPPSEPVGPNQPRRPTSFAP